MTQTALHPDLSEVLYSEETIQHRIAELGKELSADYAGKMPLLVCTLKGAIHFFSDLAKTLSIDCEYDFIVASSYGEGTETSGKVLIKKDLSTDIRDRYVIIVDDIIDSGVTLKFLTEEFAKRGAASVKTITLLNKPSRRTAAITADYAGFEIPNKFVVGYGLDYQQRYRNLPYIGILKPQVYENSL